LAQQDVPLDITLSATAERYRLVNCKEVVSNRMLCIEEYAEFPQTVYATLSYVWRGNALAAHNVVRLEFSVKGAEDADPIGLDVLHDACAAAIACGASHLWLDRLCIMQTSKTDKRWQIREMYRLYCFSTVCIVVPGGLRFLVPLSEETQWIHRGWTLQEVVAPPAVAVLFSWAHGQGDARSTELEVVMPGRSSMMDLTALLDACCKGYFDHGLQAGLDSPLRTDAFLFGKRPEVRSEEEYPNLTANMTALGFAIHKNLDTEEMHDFSIWQSALVRTSSRPVDMVLSIMGILGVALDPGDFAEDDRVGATIALAREILRQGRSASWLGVCVQIPPCPHLSTFPAFPETSVAGKAIFDLPGGKRDALWALEANYPNEAALCALPKGSMDENGYLTFRAQAVLTSPVPLAGAGILDDSLYDNTAQPRKLRAVDGSLWTIDVDNVPSDSESLTEIQSTHFPRTFAVLLGFYNGMPAETTGNNIRAMLVVEHAQGKYHVQSYFLLSFEALSWARTWKERPFCLGAPDTTMQPLAKSRVAAWKVWLYSTIVALTSLAKHFQKWIHR